MKGAKYKLGGAGFKCLMNCILLHFQAIYRSRSHEGTIPTILICHSHYHFQKWYRIIKLLFPPNPFPTFSPLLLTFSPSISLFSSPHHFPFLLLLFSLPLSNSFSISHSPSPTPSPFHALQRLKVSIFFVHNKNTILLCFRTHNTTKSYICWNFLVKKIYKKKYDSVVF